MLELQQVSMIFNKMCDKNCDKCSLSQMKNDNCEHWILQNPLLAESILKNYARENNLYSKKQCAPSTMDYLNYQTPQMRLDFLRERLHNWRYGDLTQNEIETIFNDVVIYASYPCLSEATLRSEINAVCSAGSLPWVKQTIQNAINNKENSTVVLINMNDYKEVKEYLAESNFNFYIIQFVEDNWFGFLKIEFE